ncbi:LysR family transcriptional regulator [Pseudoxanthobacter sp.]|uniref:LysR family transcriptional regulator n=1 Tax=Pseudoxanthobacter sp. TaxID=1925742 RepID=UPI002FE16535
MRRLDTIDIRLLRVFVALADAGGFAEAQVALNLSQPTLSTHLADLEKRLGGRLCQRGRQSFRLTDLGQATYEAAIRLFGDLDDFSRRVAAARGGLSGRLRIGVSDGTATSATLGIHHALARFLSPDRDVMVDLTLGTPAELEAQLAGGSRDVVVGPLPRRTPGLETRFFADEPHGLYCGAGHPLFAREDAGISRREIAGTAFSLRRYRHFDDLQLAGHPRPGALVVDMEAQLMLLLSGRFIGFLPCHLAAADVAAGRLRAIRPDLFSFASPHFVGWRRETETNALVEAFVAELLATAPAAG